MSKTKEKIWNFLIDKGFSEQATAGIMGNIQAESGFDSNATNSESGAFGLFQWLGSRKDSLLSYANKKGKLVDDIELQLDFFWSELQGSEKATLDAMTSGNHTAEEYARIFEEKFERSGGSNVDKRMQFADQIFQEYSGSRTEESTEEKSTMGLVWWGDIVKVAFILVIIAGAVAFLGMAVTSSGKTGKKVVDTVKEKTKEVTHHD